ncbi:MAG: glutamate--tRNA ligase [Synergistaceae bacterium]|jgi:glutamyl-tRNA synthetase|nr:glutamate--tRNA ligase [Synergistaceae bacterium]
MFKDGKMRVRFAPSPTGALHIGGAHTALFNWLAARHSGGTFILRIEDTDSERSTPEYERTIMEGLAWLGLDWDEGPQKGGPKGPYRQSEKMGEYTEIADSLIKSGKAYRVGDAVLFRVPAGEQITFGDIIYGEISVASEKASMNTDGTVKDIVLIKSDGTPTYNFAVVVDDHGMDVTTVIRGEDHIANTPKQILIYRALGWDTPNFAHLPMILGADKKKLSKRHGATSVFEYKDMGYLPESVFNFLALLGWTPGNDVEIFDRLLAVEKFELRKVTKKPAVFDMKKLDFVNQEHLKAMDPKARYEAIEPFWREIGFDIGKFPPAYLENALVLMGGRGKTTRELAEFSDYFLDFDVVKSRYAAEEITQEHRGYLKNCFGEMLWKFSPDNWEAEKLENFARSWCEANGVSLKEIAMPLRFALSGRKVSPGVFEIAALMGREECKDRLEYFGFVG